MNRSAAEERMLTMDGLPFCAPPLTTVRQSTGLALVAHATMALLRRAAVKTCGEHPSYFIERTVNIIDCYLLLIPSSSHQLTL